MKFDITYSTGIQLPFTDKVQIQDVTVEGLRKASNIPLY